MDNIHVNCRCAAVYEENLQLKAKVEALEAENAHILRINEDFWKERSKLVERNTNLKEKLNKIYGITLTVDELGAANEKLKTEVTDLNERIADLRTIQCLLDNRNTALAVENNKLNATITQLKRELAKYTGEHIVEFLYHIHEDGKYIIGWTEVSGEEHELTFRAAENAYDWY